MAGAGYKLFNTGDVLTAAQVNTYLMEQTVMVFANAAARTTALSGVVSEGMISYLKDTNAVEVYDGSNWVSSDDPNAIQNTIVDAKGDLITATAADTPSRIAVGNNGETLVADSSATTGLRWQGNYGAGKNAIINGDFRIWQRGTSFSNPASGAYSSDRWTCTYAGSITTWTISQQSFTPGTAPVSGYEAPFFYRSAITTIGTGSDIDHTQRIEDVRTFANQTVTLSFWAKADSSRTSLVYIVQVFGSGGSSAVVSATQNVSLTTSWQRFSFQFSVPSISGKTIGAGSYLGMAIRQVAASGSTFDIWGVQVEAGSTATAFQTATGTLAGELAACQRYYYRLGNNNTAVNRSICSGAAYASNDASGVVQFPTTMRTTPTLDATSGTNYYGFLANSATDGLNSFTLGYADTTSAIIYNNSQIAQTAGHGGVFITQNASASVAFSSEL